MLKENIKIILLYIFVIVLLFCIMYLFIYNNKEIRFDNNIKIKTFEKFNNNKYDMYLNNLNILNNNIKNNGIEITELINKVNELKNNKNKNNNIILDKLNNMFWNRYLENINRKNAVVFNEYLKYNEPEK
jgi:hypothetical protein